MTKSFTAGLAALLSATAMAQSAPRADPLDAKAATAPLVYRSAFTGYKQLAGESAALAWREANDAAFRIGGWRAYAREAAASAPSPVLAPAPAAAHRH